MLTKTVIKQNDKLRTGEMCKRGILIVQTQQASHTLTLRIKRKVK